MHFAGRKAGCVHEVEQKRNVRLDAADAELLQAAFHAAGGIDETQAVRRHLDQQRIVERRDDRAGERRPRVEANAQAARGTVVAEPAVIGHELVGRIFGRHPALDREAVLLDFRLIAQADFRIGKRLSPERSRICDLIRS